jgi:hypothetical protein
MKALLKRRDKAVERLHELAPKLLFGSASETYRTCGRPNCRCHTTGPKHGPHMYVNYKGESGRTTGYYVPKAFQEQVREGLAAWRELQVVAKEIAQLNKELLDAQRPSRKKRKKDS